MVNLLSSWLFFALLTPLLWGISSTVDEFAVTKVFKKTTSFAILIGLSVGILSLFLIPFSGLKFPSIQLTALSLIAGGLFTYAVFIYLNALTVEEVSRVIPLVKLGAIFTLILSFIFLNEKLILNHYLGFALLLIGGFLIAEKRIKHQFRLSKAFPIIMPAAFLFSASYVIMKYVFIRHAFLDSFILLGIGILISSISLLSVKKYRRDFVKSFSSLNAKMKTIMLGNEVINFGAILSINFAIFLGPVSLVVAIGSLQLLFVLIFTSILSIWFPKIIKEEITKSVIITKIISIVIMMGGLALIAF